MIGLGIDAGGSGTRWLLRDEEGNELGLGAAGPITGHVFTPADLESTRSRLKALLHEVVMVARPSAVMAGIAGFHAGSPASEALVETVCQSLALDGSRVSLADDMFIAHASVFEPGEGVLIYAGTGSFGYHVTADGRSLRTGGHGYLIDDAGGGYWIGHEGIKQALRWADEAEDLALRPLAREIYGALGSATWSDIAVAVYGAGRSKVAALAPAVGKAAAQGDEAAIDILRRAGSELARLATVLFGRIGNHLPVAFGGGVSKLSPHLNESLKAGLPNESPFRVVDIEPVSTAARLAIGLTYR